MTFNMMNTIGSSVIDHRSIKRSKRLQQKKCFSDLALCDQRIKRCKPGAL